MADETLMQEQTTPEQGDNQNDDAGEKEITLESLSADNAKLKAELAKQKLALDKALHNNGELTKQLRAKMTAQEQEEVAGRSDPDPHGRTGDLQEEERGEGEIPDDGYVC